MNELQTHVTEAQHWKLWSYMYELQFNPMTQQGSDSLMLSPALKELILSCSKYQAVVCAFEKAFKELRGQVTGVRVSKQDGRKRSERLLVLLEYFSAELAKNPKITFHGLDFVTRISIFSELRTMQTCVPNILRSLSLPSPPPPSTGQWLLSVSC